MSDEMMESPFSAMTVLATALHELYLSLVEAGFTEAQALFLVSRVMTSADGGS